MSIIASRRRFGLVIKGIRGLRWYGEVGTGMQRSAGAGLARCTDGVEPGPGSSLYNHHTAEHDLSPGIEMAIFMKINCSSVIAH